MLPANIWSTLKTALLIQRIYCLSPFYFDGKKLRAIWLIQCYTYGYLVLYITLLIISIIYLQIFAYLKEYLPNGFLWIVLSGTEFALTNASFILVLIILETSKAAQMDFLHRIARVDHRLQRHFGASVNFNKLKQFNRFIWLGQSLYYQGLALIICIYLISSGHGSVIPFVFAYQLEQATAFALTLLIVNYMTLLHSRFTLIAQLSDDIQNEYLTTISRRQQDVVVRRTIILFQIFKELSDLVLLLDKGFGLTMLIRFAHDFTLLNTQVYLIFWISHDIWTLADLWYIALALIWMLPNIIKIGWTTATVEKTIIKVQYIDLFKMKYIIFFIL